MIDKIVYTSILLITCHPLFYIFNNEEYRSHSERSLYFRVDIFSNIATSKLAIFSSFLSFAVFLWIFQESFLLGFPLVILCWILFIRDRFRSLSRGLGAPGYFNFFSVTTLFTVCLLRQDFGSSEIHFVLSCVYLLLAIEIGFIFLSAGLFKFIDSIKQPLGFTIGMLNPMWSKIYGQQRGLVFLKPLVDFLGPFLQVVAGILILCAISTLKSLGFFIIMVMFMSIIPFCRLSWLCPAIAATSYIFIYESLLPSILQEKSFLIAWFILLLARFICIVLIFKEYFFQKSATSKPYLYLLSLYRTSLGVIIWKVFTYDLVRILATTKQEQNKINLSKAIESINPLKFSKLKHMFTKTNVYDSITLTSLLCSSDYLDPLLFRARANKYMFVYNLNSISYLHLQNPLLSYDLSNPPFYRSKLLKINKSDEFESVESINDTIKSVRLSNYRKK